ncbi:MAG: Phosphoadenylyl-sulfate reductase [thioredoxin] (EC / Adenylyl-sulfate reductase [thioredoxin] (EC, partial [uncultured Sulfurovum sp.]
MSKQLADRLNSTLRKKSTDEVLDYFLNHYEESSALSSSLAAEDQVLTDLILKKYPKTKIFTLDTGRLNPETYDVMDATNLQYNFKMDVYFPNEQDVQKLYKMQGVNGQYESIENRKTCCGVRKIEPLKRALKDLDIWFTGLRASQSV